MKKEMRKIIKIDEDLCNGCGECIPACPEQALQIVETPKGPKARLVKDFYCDGLGACLGSCPTGALKIVEKEVEPYNEEATIARIKEKAPDMLDAHLEHLREHSHELLEHHAHKMTKDACNCPSVKIMQWKDQKISPDQQARVESELRQWPVQIHLVPPSAPYLRNANMVIIADCVPFAYANLHRDFIKGKKVLVGCPKLDDADAYIEKISQIIQVANPKSITVVHMEVPCCFGLIHIVEQAMKKSGKNVPLETVTMGIKGEKLP